MVKGRSMESVHRVTGFAGLLKGPQMRVLVTVATILETQILSGSVPAAMAFLARDLGVLPIERVTSLRMVHLG